MSMLHPQPTLTKEGLCRRCDNAQWREDRDHRCADPSACACISCHPEPLAEAVAVFDALDDLLKIQVPRSCREPRRNRVATPL